MTKKRKFWASLSAPRNTGGFTLMELIIALGIMAILAVGAVTVFQTWTKGYLTAKSQNEQQMVLDGMIEAVSTELRYATDVTLSNKVNFDDIQMDNELGRGRARIRIQQNQLFISNKGGNVFHTQGAGLDTWVPQDMVAKFYYEDKYHITFAITMTDNDGNSLSETTTIRLLNCEVTEEPVTVYNNQTMTEPAGGVDGTAYSAVLYKPAPTLTTEEDAP